MTTERDRENALVILLLPVFFITALGAIAAASGCC